MNREELINAFTNLATEWFGEYGYSKYQNSGNEDDFDYLSYMGHCGLPYVEDVFTEDGMAQRIALSLENAEYDDDVIKNSAEIFITCFEGDSRDYLKRASFMFSFIKKYFPDSFINFEELNKDHDRLTIILYNIDIPDKDGQNENTQTED